MRSLRYLLPLCVLGLLWAGLVLAAGEPRSQEGLAPELTIPAQPAADVQLARLQAMVQFAESQRKPGGGFLDGLKGMFGGSSRSLVVAPPELMANAEALRNRIVSVSGLYRKLTAESGQFVFDGGTCPVSVPKGTVIEGLKAEDLDYAPVTIEGVVENTGLLGQLRATRVQPCAWLALLRIGRLQERLGRYPEAEVTYPKATQMATAARSTFAAFGKLSAARIAFEELRDSKKAKSHYALAWNPYTVMDRRGKPMFYTWVPREDGSGWDKLSAAEAITKPLEALNRDGTWYRLMAFFVELAGGIHWLGIILLAVLSRVVIWPLTKKQLSSAEAMKRLQPQIKALQDRHADNKQKFQEEFWRLCQSNGVNPLGGCLPMIVQIPVLMVLWYGIRDYIVQFNGHSFLWVRNLAAPDMPLLIAYTISMVAFQKMTQKLQPNPTMNAQQAQQQQMMTYMMPLMFFVFFKGFPAAFLLYWLTTNVVYFVQQWAYSRGQDKRLEGDGTATLVETAEAETNAAKALSTKGSKPAEGASSKQSDKDNKKRGPR